MNMDGTPGTAPPGGVRVMRAAAARPRGRPPRSVQVHQDGALSKEAIHACATRMAMTEPLNELSISALAKHFGVTPALIHYYAGSRNDLIAGVVHRYFRVRVERLKPLTGDWRVDLEQHAQVTFQVMQEYGGVLRYLMSHNRFRLFQESEEGGETDLGLWYLDRVAQIFQDGGFSADQAAMGYYLFVQYVMTSAYATVNHQLPAEHTDYLRARILATSPRQYPAAHFCAEPFAQLGSAQAFTTGLQMLLDGMQAWRMPARRRAPAAKRKTTT